MQKNTCQILGSQTSYWVYNPTKKQTILMIHGFRGNHHGLQKIVDSLPDYRIIVPDLPGFDQSTPMTARRHDIAGYSEFIRLFIKNLNLEKPFLLGHSFGSIITADFAAQNPRLITKLILINPIAVSALDGPRKIISKLAILYYFVGNKLPEKPGRALLSNSGIVLGLSVLMTKTKNKQLRKEIHHNHLTHFSTFSNCATLDQAFKASISYTVGDKAANIKTPTLLIVGEIDDIAPLASQKKLAQQLADARLVVIPKTGHLIHYEAPQDAGRAILDFLSN